MSDPQDPASRRLDLLARYIVMASGLLVLVSFWYVAIHKGDVFSKPERLYEFSQQ